MEDPDGGEAGLEDDLFTAAVVKEESPLFSVPMSRKEYYSLACLWAEIK